MENLLEEAVFVPKEERHMYGGESDFEWCIHCQRALPTGYRRLLSNVGTANQYCPYSGCDGSAIDMIDWSPIDEDGIVDGLAKIYGETPQIGVIYPVI